MEHQPPPKPGDPGPRRSSWRSAFATAMVLAAVVSPVAGVLARRDWRADLLTHFPEPALAVTLLAIAAVVRRHPRLAIGLSMLAVWQAAPLITLGRPNPVGPDPGSSARLRVLMANVLCDNPHHGLLVQMIRRERPDVVGLVECTREWIEGLAELRREYPYRVEGPADPDGVALWFREPPLRMEPPRVPKSGGCPFIRASFVFAGKTRHLWLVHPLPPHLRKDLPELEALAGDVASQDGSRIVVGDLNSTDGSPHFADFLRLSGLRDSRIGFGRQPSWPS